MDFATPAWLLGLLPWAAVALYLLWGRRRARVVPFLELWRIPVEGRHVRRRMGVPPLALALALLGMLLAVVAAAGPRVRWPRTGGGTTVVVIVDRGLSMSYRGKEGPRFREVGRAVADELAQRLGRDVPIDLWFVPGRTGETADEAIHTTASELPRLLNETPPAALDVSEAVAQSARRRVVDSAGPVIVVSNAEIGNSDARIVQTSAQSPLPNVGIVAIAARATPRAQVMVRVRNDSPLTRATLRVTTSDRPDGAIERTIALPPAGGEADTFVDAKELGAIVSAEVIAPDDLPADNKAWLAREAAWPRIEPAGPVRELRRSIEVYRTVRPAGEGSATVRVWTGNAPPEPTLAGVVVRPGAGLRATATTRPTRVAPHSVTDPVTDWASFDLPAFDAAPPDGGWTPVLWAGERPLVAVRESPARQVWAALDTDGWSNRPEYVVFWTAVFDWVGHGSDTYAAHPLAELTSDWQRMPDPTGSSRAPDPSTSAIAYDPAPGIYRRGDGAIRAFNSALPLPSGAASKLLPPGEWRDPLRAALGRYDALPGRRALAPWLLIVSLVCLVLAAGAWRRRESLTAVRSARTF
jgi:hypothetical protein